MGLCDEWLEEQENKFEPERLQKMHKRFKLADGKQCGTCTHLLELRSNRTYYKCQLSKITASTATDWQKGWRACGKHEEKRR